jgi:SAM-dependent methyltransferase
MKIYEIVKSKLFRNNEQKKIESSNYYDSFKSLKHGEAKDMIKEYVHEQIDRHVSKGYKTRDEDFYFKVATVYKSLLEQKLIEPKKEYDMICLGTRNNHERDCFSRYFSLQPEFSKPLAFEYNINVVNVDNRLTSEMMKNRYKMELDRFFKESEDFVRILKKYNFAISNVHVHSLDIAPDSEADYVQDFNSFSEDWTSKWDFIYSNSLDHAMVPTDAFREWVRILKPGGVMIVGFDLNLGSEEVNSTDCCSFTREQVVDFIENEKNITYVADTDTGGHTHFAVIKK